MSATLDEKSGTRLIGFARFVPAMLNPEGMKLRVAAVVPLGDAVCDGR